MLRNGVGPVSTEVADPKVQSPNTKASIGDVVGILGLIAAAPAGLVALLALLRYFRLRTETKREQHGELSLGNLMGIVEAPSDQYMPIERRQDAYVASM